VEPAASIVSVAVADAVGAEAALAEAGIRCAVRGGNIRLSPHVYNTPEEIDFAVECVARFVG
jgi:selenocysteine lyase/cysteine desulfurase